MKKTEVEDVVDDRLERSRVRTVTHMKLSRIGGEYPRIKRRLREYLTGKRQLKVPRAREVEVQSDLWEAREALKQYEIQFESEGNSRMLENVRRALSDVEFLMTRVGIRDTASEAANKAKSSKTAFAKAQVIGEAGNLKSRYVCATDIARAISKRMNEDPKRYRLEVAVKWDTIYCWILKAQKSRQKR